MIARLGLSALAPFVLPSLAFLTLGGGIGGYVWWNELADLGVTTLALISGACLLASLLSGGAITRLSMMIFAVCTAAIAGILYQHQSTEQQLNQLREQHERIIAKLHGDYKAVAVSERERQVEVNQKALAEAALVKKKLDEERKGWIEERRKFRKEASDDQNADRPALGLDAVDRLNRLRYDPKSLRPRRKGPRRGKPAS